MSEPRVAQLPLDFAPAPTARFATFVRGPNAAAVEQARAIAVAGRGAAWLYGPAGSGKTHLLQAACFEAAAAGRRAMYLPLDALGTSGAEAIADLEALDVLALDDLERVVGEPAWETRLFRAFNDTVVRGTGLLVAAEAAPRQLPFGLPDLASRAAGAAVYRLQPLGDDERAQALIEHARARGIELDAAAAEYLLSRVARDMRELVEWLARFDRESLATRQRVTIALIRRVLGERG